MTHNELLTKLEAEAFSFEELHAALRAVVEFHKPRNAEYVCIHCSRTGIWIAYPCPTIEAIEKELG